MPYQQVNLATLRSQLQAKYEGSPFWSNEEARLAINESLRVWNALTGFWRTSVSVVTGVLTPYITLPAPITFATSVDESGRPLGKTSLFSMDSARPGWDRQNLASGGSVPTTIQMWMPVGVNQIAIWPSDDVGGTTLTVSGVLNTPILLIDADFISIGSEDLNVLLGYCLHILSFKQGSARFKQTLPALERFYQAAMGRNTMLSASEPFSQAALNDPLRQEDPPYRDGRFSANAERERPR